MGSNDYACLALEGLMSMKNDSGAANMGKLHQLLMFKMYMEDLDCLLTPADEDEESFKRIDIRACCKLQRVHIMYNILYSRRR